MSDPRKAVFDDIRQKVGAITARDVQVAHAVMDALGYPRAPEPERAPGRRLSQKGVDLIHSFEALKLTSYKDPGSVNGLPVTNGWGTTVDEDGGPIPLGARWTKEKADRLFLRDVAALEDEVSELLGSAPTTQNQFDALVSFQYNTGALGQSTLLRKHKAKDYAGAVREFARWNKNDGVVLRGLTRRRKAEADLYEA